jgi:RNA polymerase sigma-70 factor (ECF subfamily)
MSNTNRDPRKATDEELVRTAQGDHESPDGKAAATELLGRYDKAVYLWCFRYVKEHERALDLAQDVLINAYRGLGSFAGKSKFSSWLFSIARNRCLNEVQRVSLLVDEEADLETIPSGEKNPDIDLEEEESRERLIGLIRETLEPEEQKAIWLRCFERVPVDEITRLLGIEASTGARGVLQRARRKLRTALDRSGVGDVGT